MLPGQDFVQGALTAGEPVHLQIAVVKGPLPQVEAEVLAPGVELCAELPGSLDDIAQPAVAAREKGFDEGLGRVVPCEVNRGIFQLLLQQADLLADGRFFLHRHPLEGGVGLGHERADADAHVGLVAQDAAPDGQHLFGEIGNGLDVVERLGWVADHEVHLDRFPAAAVDLFGSLQQIIVWDRLIDDVAQAVGGGFGREGEAGAAAPLFQQVHEVDAEALDTQAGQADGQPAFAVAFHGAAHQLFDIGIVAAAEAEEADLFEAAVGDHLVDRLQDLFQRPFADGAEDHAGLAEAATARAAAHDFDGGAVVDDVNEGDDEVGDRRRHDGHDPLHHGGGGVGVHGADGGDCAVGGVAGRVERGHIDAWDLGEHGPELAAVLRWQLRAAFAFIFPLLVYIDDLEDHLFAFADDHCVEKGAHRLRVVAAGAAGDYKRVGAVAVGGAQGKLRQVEHGEDVGIELLVGEREGEDVEPADRMARLQTEEGDAVAAHDLFEVTPRAVDAFGHEVVSLVDQVVQDHEPEVGAAELVDVGKGEGHLAADGGVVPVFGDAVELAAGVAGGLGHFV